jgi:hypothetical protein
MTSEISGRRKKLVGVVNYSSRCRLRTDFFFLIFSLRKQDSSGSSHLRSVYFHSWLRLWVYSVQLFPCIDRGLAGFFILLVAWYSFLSWFDASVLSTISAHYQENVLQLGCTFGFLSGSSHHLWNTVMVQILLSIYPLHFHSHANCCVPNPYCHVQAWQCS